MRRTYRAPPRLSPLEKAAIAVIVLCVGSLYLRYLSVVSGASADGAPRTAGPEGAREKAWLMPECYYLQAHTCSRMEWKVMPPDDAAGGGGTRSVEVAEAWTTRWRIMQPGLWGEDTLSFILCDDPVRGGVRHFLSHTGCDIEVGPEVDDIFYRQSASFVRHQGRYYNGFFTLEAADFEGHYITSRGGVLALEPEDTRAEFRRDASWVMESDGRQRSSSLRTGVFLLKQPLPPGTEVPVVIDDERTCAKEHNGCCQITEDGFVMPKTKDLGPADPATTDVTAIIISSKNTIGKRRSLLDTWLLKPLQQPRKFNSVWTQAVISLDCFTDDIETSVPNTDWVVGPLGAGPVGVPIIVIRVTMITHWAFDRYPNSSWYLTIDDDTLVFTDNIFWMLSYLPNPHEKQWYVGHTAEWKIKMWFHGSMAFGGGGILVSNKGGRTWKDFWHGGLMTAAKTWLLSGRCSHAGGDGAVCRCLRAAYGRDDMLTNWKGLHQFDITGTAEMLDLVRDTCPVCPSIYEQTGFWIDDVVSQNTVSTFHHLLAIGVGSIYPGLDGNVTGLLFYDAYDAYPSHLLLKRFCGRTTNELYTVCINLGHQIQLFRSELDPAEAFVLMDVGDGTANPRPTEGIVSIGLRPHVRQALFCSLHYQWREGRAETVYVGSFTVPRAEHDPPCEGRAAVRVHNSTLTARISLADGTDMFWTQSID